MKRKQKATWFLSVILAACLLNSVVFPALALFSRTIQVQSGIGVYLDDKKLDPKDANGNPVEVFSYNGTTYLPVRAVSEALNIPIQWDGSTQSVYLGKHTGDKPAVWVSELDYFDKKEYWNFDKTTKDNLGNEHKHSIQSQVWNSNYVTYKLNEQYSNLSGLFYQIYDKRSTNGQTTLSIYADGEVIWTATVKAGIDPVEFNLNVKGVNELKLSLEGAYTYNTAIGELGLWT